MKNLRILQIANQPGPLYLFMQPLSRELRDAGYEVELACMPTGPMWQSLNECGFKVHALPAGSWSKMSTWINLYRHLRRFFQENRFDLMIVHTPAMSWVARPAARGLVEKTLYFAHGLPFAPEQNPLMRFIFRCVETFMARYTDAVIVMNQDDAEACRTNRLTRGDGQWFYVPGVGVDIAEYDQPFSPEAIRELEGELGLSAGKPMVLFLGRFIPTKRPGDVLELVRRIGPKADFVLAGEGPLWESIRQSAEGIGSHVHVLKFTEKTKLLLARSSVLVLPSVFREGLPRVLLEAQAAGKPAVAYDVRGSRDVIEDGETGFLIKPCDIDSLCEAVNKILRNDDLRNRMGDAGRTRIRENFALKIACRSAFDAVSAVMEKSSNDQVKG